MVFPILIPEISKPNNKDDSMPKLDFKAISNGIIEGGADIIFNRFNIGVKMTPEIAKQNLLEGLVKNEAYFHQLSQLSYPEHFGVYFEIYEKRTGQKQIDIQKETAQKPLEESFSKIPDKYKLLNDKRWAIAMLKWNIKENFRMMRSPVPVCKGLIFIDKYIYNDEYNLCGDSVINYAIATTKGYTDILENIGASNKDAKFLKMFDTSFLVENKKPLNKNMKAYDILSLREHITGITYNFKLTNNTPAKAYIALAKEFEYEIFGSEYILDRLASGKINDIADQLDLNDMKEMLPGMRINLKDSRGSNICLSLEPYQKDNYKFTLSDLGCDVAAEFMARFTNEMGRLNATTSRKVNYKNMFSEMTSVYLPGFPMANTNTISLSYPGSLSSLGKD